VWDRIGGGKVQTGSRGSSSPPAYTAHVALSTDNCCTQPDGNTTAQKLAADFAALIASVWRRKG
jgi:hypothetical protein